MVANWDRRELQVHHQEAPSHQGLQVLLAFHPQEGPSQVHQVLEKAPCFLEFDFYSFRGFD